MARFTVICYVLFGLSNLRVTLCSPPSPGEGRTDGGREERGIVRENEDGQGWLEGGRLYFASILRQIAAYLSDFCPRTKPSTAFLARGMGPGRLRGLRVKWIGFARRSARVSERATTRALIRASRFHDFRFDIVFPSPADFPSFRERDIFEKVWETLLLKLWFNLESEKKIRRRANHV